MHLDQIFIRFSISYWALACANMIFLFKYFDFKLSHISMCVFKISMNVQAVKTILKLPCPHDFVTSHSLSPYQIYLILNSQHNARCPPVRNKNKLRFVQPISHSIQRRRERLTHSIFIGKVDSSAFY